MTGPVFHRSMFIILAYISAFQILGVSSRICCLWFFFWPRALWWAPKIWNNIMVRVSASDCLRLLVNLFDSPLPCLTHVRIMIRKWRHCKGSNGTINWLMNDKRSNRLLSGNLIEHPPRQRSENPIQTKTMRERESPKINQIEPPPRQSQNPIQTKTEMEREDWERRN